MKNDNTKYYFDLNPMNVQTGDIWDTFHGRIQVLEVGDEDAYCLIIKNKRKIWIFLPEFKMAEKLHVAGKSKYHEK